VSVAEILAEERVCVLNDADGVLCSKEEVLERVAALLAAAEAGATRERIRDVLTERERLQSTGVGGGVAVPHGSLAEIDRQVAALLICPRPIPFDAVDGLPVRILFALVGPKGAPAQHLKILARVSRLLRPGDFRERLASASDRAEAYRLVCEQDRGVP
jgi:PTS system nitrogen regulatory IIA component